MEKAKASGLLILLCVFNLFLASMVLANDVVVDENGNVGIGIIEPQHRLEVDGTIKTGELLIGPWPVNEAYLFLGSDELDQSQVGNYALLQHGSIGRTYLNSPLDIRFRVNNQDQMIVDNAGNVGIGTSSPDTELHIRGRRWPPKTGQCVKL